MDPVATETTETPVVEKSTEKVVEETEDTPVVASEEPESAAVPVVEVTAPVEEKEEEVPAVESTGDAEVTENGNGDAAEHVEEADESIKRKAVDDEASEVPEKKAKTDEVEAAEPAEEVTA